MIFNGSGDKIAVDWSQAGQPIAERPFWKDYVYARSDESAHKRSLALEVPFHHFAEHYQTHPVVAQYLRPNSWKRIHLSHDVELSDYDDYKNWIVGYTFPQEIRLSAERAAGRLVRSLELRTRKQVSRDRLTGRIDRHKIQRIERDVAKGDYVHELVRPYYRVDKVDSDLPTIAIVGAMHTSAMSDRYCRKMIELILTLRFACETAGLPVVSAATQGADFGTARYYGRTSYELSSITRDMYGECDDVTQVFVLSTPDYQPNYKVYSAFQYEALWMRLKVHLKGTHDLYADIIAGLEGGTYRTYSLYNASGLYDCFGTDSGGYAVSWARDVAKADIVIACGKMFDRDRADLWFPHDIDTEEAISLLEKKLGG